MIARTLILIIMLHAGLSGQTLDSLISIGLQRNAQLQSLTHAVEAERYRTAATSAYPAPVLGLEFSQVPFSSLNIVNGLSNTMSLTQMIPLGGKITAMERAADEGRQRAEQNAAAYQKELIAKITMSYAMLWETDRELQILHEQMDLFDRLSSSLTAQYQTNRSTQADILDLQSEIALLRAEITTRTHERTGREAELRALIGLDDGLMKIVPDSLLHIDTLLFSTSSLVPTIEQHPVLKKMEAMIRMNEREAAAASAEMVPDLMVGAMVMRMPRGMLLTASSVLPAAPMNETEYMYGIMASVSLPFLPWSRSASSAKEEEYISRSTSAALERTDMLRSMRAAVTAKILYTRGLYDTQRQYELIVLPSYRDAARARNSAFVTNQSTFTQVIDAFRMLRMQEMKYVMVKAQLASATAEIEMMTVSENLKTQGI